MLFTGGFSKTANLEKKVTHFYGLLNGAGGTLAGAGVGLLARSRFENRFKKDSEKNTKDRFIGKAPLLGALLGGTVAYGVGKKRFSKHLARFFGGVHNWEPPSSRGFRKTAKLLNSVKLRPHQEELINQVHENNGSLLVAHATGVGKTLGGIAAVEDLIAQKKATKAIVVVPASLRSNFVDGGIKKFTNSSVSIYGPKGEVESKNVGDKSNSTYNVISYDLFREHGPEIIKNTGADTLVMDEVHRARATEGVTYNKLRDLRSQFKNVITLTGSVVNNDPNEIVPLLDITYGPTGHKLVSKAFFDKLFVNKQAKTTGLINTKTTVEKSLKNKPQLAKYLSGKVSYVPHEAVEELLPKKNLELVHVNMTPEQKRLYDFSLSSVDPLTRWKIRNNLPVGQKEAQEAFGKLMQARQVATDPGVLDAELAKKKDPAEYSPKVKRVVEDLNKHLSKNDTNKSVIYGNLLHGQLHAVEKSLKARGIDYSTFYGVGNEGNSARERVKNLKEFQEGSSRVLLISGAGAEGLDLKNANMLQMLEGHYNPERIHQAESRIRRMGSPLKEIHIKRYVSVPSETKAGTFAKSLLSKTPVGGNTGIDEWIYSIANKKSALNGEFRGVLDVSGESHTKRASDELQMNNFQVGAGFNLYGGALGKALVGNPAAYLMKKRTDQEIETKLKQSLLNRGYENLTAKKHYPKILAESKFDEKAIDANLGVGLLTTGLGIMTAFDPSAQQFVSKHIGGPLARGIERVLPGSSLSGVGRGTGGMLRQLLKNPVGRGLAVAGLTGVAMGAAGPVLGEFARRKVLNSSVDTNSKDLDRGIETYREKLRKAFDRKYKGSKSFVNEYETKKELGIDVVGRSAVKWVAGSTAAGAAGTALYEKGKKDGMKKTALSKETLQRAAQAATKKVELMPPGMRGYAVKPVKQMGRFTKALTKK